MPRLEVEFHCMCLLVPDPQPGTDRGRLHVLMPNTSHAGPDEHIVRLDYVATDGKAVQQRLEGWCLTLGKPTASARMPLTLPKDGSKCHLVNITPLTRDATHPNGYLIPRPLVEGNDDRVATRITFTAGSIISTEVQPPDWMLNGVAVSMANRVTWRIDLEDTWLPWTMLRTTDNPAPLASLDQILPERAGDAAIFRLQIYHMSRKAMGSGNGKPSLHALDEKAIQHHFQMFYQMFDPTPNDDPVPLLPSDYKKPDPESGGDVGWGCKLALAAVQPA